MSLYDELGHTMMELPGLGRKDARAICDACETAGFPGSARRYLADGMTLAEVETALSELESLRPPRP